MKKTANDGQPGSDSESCECSCCDCDEPAVTTDDGGTPVCEECADYFVGLDGEVHCSRETDGLGGKCPSCGDEIDWGRIQTAQYQSNHREGTCGCKGRRWSDTERGNGFPGQIQYGDQCRNCDGTGDGDCGGDCLYCNGSGEI